MNILDMEDCNINILIVSHNPFSSTANNGKTLEAMFKGYLAENLSQLFFSEMTPDLDFCPNYFRITDKDVIKNVLSVKREYFTSVFSLQESRGNLNHSSLFSLLKSWIKEVPFIRDFIWYIGKWKITSLFKWIGENKPDCIFFVGGNYGFSHSVARKLSRRYKIPLIVYFTDDYLISPITRNCFDWFQRRRMKRFYRKTIQQASLCFAIGEEMTNVYQKYFSKSFYPIMNMVPLEAKLPYVEHEGIVISYFGGLHLDRWNAIIKLGQIIRRLQKRDPNLPNVEVDVYTRDCPENVKSQFEKYNITYKGFVTEKCIRQEFAKSDILLHVESSDRYYRSLTKLSVSTKIPEYLSTGRSVLGFGPREVASMKLLSDNQIGFVISDDLGDEGMEQEIRKLLCSKDLRDELANKAYNYACQKFDPTIIRQDFMEKVNKVVNI